MAGLVPAISLRRAQLLCLNDRDRRDKPGDDDGECVEFDRNRPWSRVRQVTNHFDQAALSSPSCVSAVTPSSRPISWAILPLITFSTVVPVKCILWPVAAGRLPTRKSLKAGPVWVPPPSHRPTT